MERHAADRQIQFDPIIPNEMMMMAGWQLMQLPPILMTAWWHQVMQACLPFLPTQHQHPKFHEEHDQLVVPEPIEEEGEHALFA